MSSRFVAAIALGVLVVTGCPAYAAVDSGDLCKETKNKAARKQAFDLPSFVGRLLRYFSMVKTLVRLRSTSISIPHQGEPSPGP